MTDAPRIPSLMDSCLRKKRYKTSSKADRARDDCMAQRPERKLRSYHCNYCSCWHLTSEPTMVDRQAHAVAAVVTRPKPVPVMLDLRCPHCRKIFGARATTAETYVACTHCRGAVPITEPLRLLAEIRLCQEQSEDVFRLRTLRTERGLKTSDIATAVGIDREFLRGWLDGAHPLAAAQLKRVRDFMGGL